MFKKSNSLNEFLKTDLSYQSINQKSNKPYRIL